MKKIISRIKFLYAIILAVTFRCFFSFIPQKDYWVIMERGKDARDNGYFFYKYMKDNHPDKKIYYIIDENSADYHKVKSDAVRLYSLKYYWVVFTCEKYISTHYNCIIRGLYKYRNLTGIQKKYCFLQHGIIKDFIPSLCKEKFSTRLFVCGAYPEYEYLLKTYGHSEDVVKYTGLARFDNLHNVEAIRQILVMPTWRNNYFGEFENSDYYKNWKGFLQDKNLIKTLEENNINLIFYPHYEVQKYLKLFDTDCKNIILASFEDYDVQTLLKESSVLITDYSSVYFDFAYMKKPVIYFQFDKDVFFKNHYLKGYFDYDTMGFGKVCETIGDTVCEVSDIIKNDFSMSSYYLQRTESFFPLYDKDNCQRIYNEIINS